MRLVLADLCFAKHERCLCEFESFCELQIMLCELCLPKVKDVWANLAVFASPEGLPGAADLKFLQDVPSEMQISGKPTTQARRPVQGARGGWGAFQC